MSPPAFEVQPTHRWREAEELHDTTIAAWRSPLPMASNAGSTRTNTFHRVMPDPAHCCATPEKISRVAQVCMQSCRQPPGPTWRICWMLQPWRPSTLPTCTPDSPSMAVTLPGCRPAICSCRRHCSGHAHTPESTEAGHRTQGGPACRRDLLPGSWMHSSRIGAACAAIRAERTACLPREGLHRLLHRLHGHGLLHLQVWAARYHRLPQHGCQWGAARLKAPHRQQAGLELQALPLRLPLCCCQARCRTHLQMQGSYRWLQYEATYSLAAAAYSRNLCRCL